MFCLRIGFDVLKDTFIIFCIGAGKPKDQKKAGSVREENPMNNDIDDILSNEPSGRRGKRSSHRLGFAFFQALYGPRVFLGAVYKQAIVLTIMFLWGAAIFMYFEHLPFVSAMLASVSTVKTIGLYVPNGGNFLNVNSTETVLLIGMIIISVGAGHRSCRAS